MPTYISVHAVQWEGVYLCANIIMSVIAYHGVMLSPIQGLSCVLPLTQAPAQGWKSYVTCQHNTLYCSACWIEACGVWMWHVCWQEVMSSWLIHSLLGNIYVCWYGCCCSTLMRDSHIHICVYMFCDNQEYTRVHVVCLLQLKNNWVCIPIHVEYVAMDVHMSTLEAYYKSNRYSSPVYGQGYSVVCWKELQLKIASSPSLPLLPPTYVNLWVHVKSSLP